MINQIVVNARFLTRRVTGLERYAAEMAKALKKLRPDLRFVAPRNVIDKNLAYSLGVEYYGFLRDHLWEQIDLPRYLRKFGNPLLINLANTAPIDYKRNLVVIHDVAFLRNPRWFSRRAARFFKFLVTRVARDALTVVTDSEFSRQEIVKLLRIPKERIHIVYPSVPEVFLSSGKTHREDRYGEYILTVSSLEPRKNLRNLLIALEKVDLGKTKVVIVGLENRKVFGNRKLQVPRNLEGKVVFTGYTSDEDLVGLYQNAKFLIYPSIYEGFGFPPLEALACGCPVVASDIAPIREVCGDAVTYCNPHHIDSIARGINDALNGRDLRTRQSIERQLSKFSWEKAARELMEIAQEAAETT